MMPMKPTISMIAEAAGVSRGTVDRVIHGRPNVKPDKRERVLRALRELDYSPNPAARALALNDKKIKVAVILPSWTGMFETEVRRGIRDAVEEFTGYGLEISVESYRSETPADCVRLLEDAAERGVRGVAVCGKNAAPLRDKLLQLKAAGIAVLTYNSDIPDSGRLCFVGENIVKGGRIAAEIMAKLAGPREPILVVCGNLEFDAHKSRVDGFVQRYTEHGRAACLLPVVQTHNDYALTLERVGEALAAGGNRPAGLYMANESVPACVEAVKKAGLAGRLRLVCHDLSDTTAQYLRDGTVDFVIGQNLYRQGYLPVSMLADLLIAGKPPRCEVEYTRTHIVNAENID